MEAILALEDGTVFHGHAAGAEGEARGEVVFNTSMTGYQEVLTDPSYSGQIVTMTCPEIGNYGVSSEDVESRAPQVAGFIIRDESPMASNWRSERHAARLSRRQPHRRDFRHRHARAHAAAAVGRRHARRDRHRQRSGSQSARRARALDSADGRIGSRQRRDDDRGRSTGPQEDPDEFGITPARRAKRRLKIAAYDFGMKWNILRRLSAHGCDVRVYPATTPASRAARDEPRRRVSEQRPRRPGAAHLRHRQREDAGRVERAGVRHLSRPSDSRPGDGRQHLQAEVRPPRRESSGEEARDRQGRNHVAESRLCGRSDVAARRRRGDAPESVRRHRRRAAAQDPAGVLRAVSSRGVTRSARRGLSVRRLSGAHRGTTRDSARPSRDQSRAPSPHATRCHAEPT